MKGLPIGCFVMILLGIVSMAVFSMTLFRGAEVVSEATGVNSHTVNDIIDMSPLGHSRDHLEGVLGAQDFEGDQDDPEVDVINKFSKAQGAKVKPQPEIKKRQLNEKEKKELSLLELDYEECQIELEKHKKKVRALSGLKEREAYIKDQMDPLYKKSAEILKMIKQIQPTWKLNDLK